MLVIHEPVCKDMKVNMIRKNLDFYCQKKVCFKDLTQPATKHPLCLDKHKQ